MNSAEVRAAAERIAAALIRGENFSANDVDVTIEEFLGGDESMLCDSIDSDDLRLVIDAALGWAER